MQHITYSISNPVYVESQPPPPFSMLYKKEANSRDRKFNIEKGGGGSIVEIRKEICLKYSKMTKCLNTFVAHCSLLTHSINTGGAAPIKKTPYRLPQLYLQTAEQHIKEMAADGLIEPSISPWRALIVMARKNTVR